MVHRLHSVPLSKDAFQKEVSNIKRLPESNDIRIDFVSLIRKKRVIHLLDGTTTHQPQV